MPARPTFVLISFVSSHSFNRPFTCEICGKTWVKLGKLRDHLKTHSTEKNELCDLCGRAFKTRAELKDHKSDAHTEGNTCYVFSCHGNEVSEVSFLRWRDILSGPNLNMVAWCLSLNMVMQIWWMHRRFLACFIFYGYGVYRLFLYLSIQPVHTNIIHIQKMTLLNFSFLGYQAWNTSEPDGAHLLKCTLGW